MSIICGCLGGWEHGVVEQDHDYDYMRLSLILQLISLDLNHCRILFCWDLPIIFTF